MHRGFRTESHVDESLFEPTSPQKVQSETDLPPARRYLKDLSQTDHQRTVDHLERSVDHCPVARKDAFEQNAFTEVQTRIRVGLSQVHGRLV